MPCLVHRTPDIEHHSVLFLVHLKEFHCSGRESLAVHEIRENPADLAAPEESLVIKMAENEIPCQTIRTSQLLNNWLLYGTMLLCKLSYCSC